MALQQSLGLWAKRRARIDCADPGHPTAPGTSLTLMQVYHTTLFGRFAKRVARASGHPRSFVIALLTELNQSDFDQIRMRYAELARCAREDLKKGRRDTGRPDV